MTAPWIRRPLTAPEAAIVGHPDRRTPWAPSIAVTLHAPVQAAVIAERLAALATEHPILDSRLVRGAWQARSGRLTLETFEERLLILRWRPELRTGPPLRAALRADGRELVLVAHHAALDGRALVLIAQALLGRPQADQDAPPAATGPAPTSASPATGGAREALRRLAHPASRVAPSAAAPAAESFVACPAPPGAVLRVASVAAAAAQAAHDWNAARRAPWQRVGLTIPVGGSLVIGNVSTHRRVDVPADADVAAAVQAALATSAAPPDAALSPRRAQLLRLLAPVSMRLSDSLLVSNLGVVELPGAAHVDFFPQSRGRSAVAVGVCTASGGDPRLTLRARDLSPPDAAALLDALVAALRG